NLDALRERQGDNWLRVLAALQGMAAGWLYLGKEQQARPILTEARNWLFLEKSARNAKQQGARTALASEHIRAIGQAPIDLALTGIRELFENGLPLRDTLSTCPYYSLAQLDAAEAVVWAVSDLGLSVCAGT